MGTNSDQSVGFQIGDVVFSVLPIDQFQGKHAGTWMYLNGDSYSGTGLAGLVNFQDELLPDARGVFIRGMNNMRGSRKVSEGDQEGDRLIGSPQKDSVQDHHHEYLSVNSRALSLGGADFVVSDVLVYSSTLGTSNVDGRGLNPVNLRINAETRPKNIALYVYIKVSE